MSSTPGDLSVVVENVVQDLAFEGNEGVTISALLDLVDRIYNDFARAHDANSPNEGGNPPAPLCRADRAVQVEIWNLLRAHADFYIGEDREGNHLTLDEIEALPVRKGTSSSHGDDNGTTDDASIDLQYRPLIYVSEQRQWQAVTGHRKDLDRLPKFEWQCLVYIAKARSAGISQPELVAITGQDKRSLPRRTDFLQQKGYIVKRQVVASKALTSWLILKKFMIDNDPARLPVEVLTRDLEPVPGYELWTGDAIDTGALVDTALAIMRAWKVMKITDLQRKLGILKSRRPRSRFMKFLRALNELRILKRCSAAFPNAPNRVFKDCVRFNREPTIEEVGIFQKRPTSTVPKKSRAKIRIDNESSEESEITGSEEDYGDISREQEQVHSDHVRLVSGLEAEGNVQVNGDLEQNVPLISPVSIKGQRENARPVELVEETMRTDALQTNNLPEIPTPDIIQTDVLTQSTLAAVDQHRRTQPKNLSRRHDSKPVSKPDLDPASNVTSVPLAGAQPQTSSTYLSEVLAMPTEIAMEIPVSQEEAPNADLRPESPVVAASKASVQRSPAVMTHDSKPPAKRRGRPPKSASRPAATHINDEGVEQDLEEVNALSSNTHPEHVLEVLPRLGGRLTRRISNSDAKSTRELDAEQNTEEANTLSSNTHSEHVTDLPIKRRGRPPKRSRAASRERKVIYKSYDECQREEGISGVYFDIDEIKRFKSSEEPCQPSLVALFKSEKIKSLPWMRHVPGQDPAAQDSNQATIAPDRSDQEDDAEDVEPIEGPPYVCKLCEGKWKNLLGLQYHLTKARVSCNPNYDPSVQPKKRGPRERHETSDPAPTDVETPAPLTNAAGFSPNQAKTRRGRIVKKPTSYAEQVVEDLDSDSPEPAPKRVRRISLVGDRDDIYEPQMSPAPAKKLPPPDIQPMKDIIMDLLDANGGLFPGNRALWYAIATLWAQRFPGTDIPAFRLTHIAVASLEDCNLITRFKTRYPGPIGKSFERAIISKPEIDLSSPPASDLKNLVKSAVPNFYVPPEFTPPPDVQTNLQQMEADSEERRSLLAIQSTIDASSSGDETVEVLQAPYYHVEALQKVEDRDVNFLETKTTMKDQDMSIRVTAQHYTPEILDEPIESSIPRKKRGRPPKLNKSVETQESSPKRRRKKQLDIQSSRPSPPRQLIPGSQLLPTSIPESESFGDVQPAHPTPIPLLIDPALQDIPPSIPKENLKLYQSTELVFLPPNAETEHIFQLETGKGSLLQSPSIALRNISAAAVSFGIQFIDAGILRIERDGAPVLEEEDFESRSFIVQGWFPSTKFIFEQNMPRSFEDIPYMQGPRTVSEFGVTTRFVRGVQRTERWELDNGFLLSLGTLAPNFRFINLTIKKLKEAEHGPKVLQWPTAHAFTIDSFPYDQVVAESTDDGVPESSEVQPPPRQPPPQPSSPRARAPPQPMRTPAASIPLPYSISFATRRVTAVSSDLHGVIDELPDHPDFAVEIYLAPGMRRKRTTDAVMSPEMEFRFLVAITAIRTLTGGIDRRIDWVLAAKVLDQYTVNFLRQRWASLKPNKQDYIEQLGNKFQNLFLGAYERGEIPIIDYDHLLDYDWNYLIDWATSRLNADDGSTSTLLPATRTRLDQLYAMKEDEDCRLSREHLMSSTAYVSVVRRMEFLTSENVTMEIPKTLPLPPEDPRFRIARSWVLATCMTPESSYNIEFTTRKLTMIGERFVAAGIEDLLTSKSITVRNKGRSLPGRSFGISDTFNAALRKRLDDTHCVEAALFKHQLDEKLTKQETTFVEDTANEGSVLAITNLQAFQRIRLRQQNVPNNKFGVVNNYQTKRMNKSVLRFQMQIEATERYLYDHGNSILSKLQDPAFMPPKSPDGAIPLWYDINDGPLPKMWRKALSAVLETLAMRPGLKIRDFVRAFDIVLEDWEVKLVLEWAARVGIVVNSGEALGIQRGMGEEEEEAWTVSEWWWLVAGHVIV